VTDPPNIVYLHSHDTGRYVQPYGHFIPTPNIQLLADQGILFRKAFATASSCSGSRASLVTGQYPHSNGMIGLAHRGFELFDYSQHVIGALRRAGYHSELIGEQHISEDLDILGYDNVRRVDGTHVEFVAPEAVDFLTGGPPEPFFLSVGFFETHRTYFAPTSVRDTLYSMPPASLPDVIETRRDMAAFKASARSLDHGVGGVLNALMDSGLGDRTLVVCTTDHGLALPGLKAGLLDGGIGVMLIMRGPGGFGGGKVVDALVSQIDLYPTLCELAGIETPEFAQGQSLLPLVRGETDAVRDELFAEITYHAAYDPQRAVRTDRYKYVRRFIDGGPVLANCDDSTTKDLLIELGWADRPIDPEQLYDLALDPNEFCNVAADPHYAGVRADLARRLERWMDETGDPLLAGHVPAPPGAAINTREQRSADDPPIIVPHGDPLAAVGSPTDEFSRSGLSQ
jgi:N-sulfoglucosamine sulfohydrolase